MDSNGILTYIPTTSTSISFPQQGAESIPPFQRAISLSDSSSICTTVLNSITSNVLCYTIEKTVTSVVTWTDFSGVHESRLTTILRKI